MKNAKPARAGSWFGRIAVLATVAVLAAGAWSAWERLDTPVSLVKVSGELTAGERARAIEIVTTFLPARVFGMDTQALQDRLVAESWIDAASVRRRWPDTVELRISPEVAVARWRDDALLSSRGEVIEPLELLGADALPRLAGVDGSEEDVMQVFQLAAEMLRPLDLTVAELAQDETGEVQVTTRSGLVISLGSVRHAARLKRVAAVIERGLTSHLAAVARLDARYDNGVAVAWQDASLDLTATAQLMNRSIKGSTDTWPLPRQR